MSFLKNPEDALSSYFPPLDFVADSDRPSVWLFTAGMSLLSSRMIYEEKLIQSVHCLWLGFLVVLASGFRAGEQLIKG